MKRVIASSTTFRPPRDDCEALERRNTDVANLAASMRAVHDRYGEVAVFEALDEAGYPQLATPAARREMLGLISEGAALGVSYGYGCTTRRLTLERESTT